MVLLFFRLRTSKTWLKVLSRNCIGPLMWSNIFFCMACRVRSPMLRDTLEIKCLLQSRFPSIFHMQPHMLHYIKLTAAWNNDLSRLHMILFKQPKTLVLSSFSELFPLPTMVKFEKRESQKNYFWNINLIGHKLL